MNLEVPGLILWSPDHFWRDNDFSANSGGELSGALVPNVSVQLASHLNVLYTLEFSLRFNGSQWRSISVFGAYIEVSLIEFFGGSILSKAGNLSNIL